MQPLGDIRPSPNTPVCPVLRKSWGKSSGRAFPAAVGKQGSILLGRRSSCWGQDGGHGAHALVLGAAVGSGWSGCAEDPMYGCDGSLRFLQLVINDVG